MADSEFELLRAKRLAELKHESGISGGDGGITQKATEDGKRESNEMRNSILSQVLNQSARARLNTLMLGKPEKGQMVESMLLQMAQRGQIMGQLGEKELISILERVSQQMQTNTKVKFDRRRVALDDSDDDL